MKKWNFFKWTRDNQKRFADEVAAELDSKASKESVDKLIADALSQSDKISNKPLVIDLPPKQNGLELPLTFKVLYRENGTTRTWGFGVSSISSQLYFMHNGALIAGLCPGLGFFPSKENMTLGHYKSFWSKTYTKKINNGEDIEIPAKAGTMALVSDIEDILRQHGLIPTETTEQEEQA